MPASRPQDVDLLLAQAMNAGDLEAAVALYERAPAFVPQPGTVVTGTDAIREAPTGFMAMKLRLSLTVPGVVLAGDGDLALLKSEWSMSGVGPDGSPINLTGRGAEVVRRQPDQTWGFVVDDPFAGS